jgi:hypothetical protein
MTGQEVEKLIMHKAVYGATCVKLRVCRAERIKFSSGALARAPVGSFRALRSAGKALGEHTPLFTQQA